MSLNNVQASADSSTPVTLANVTDNYLSIDGQAITAGTVPLSLGGTGATSASAARTALDVDVAGTDNSTDVTLATVANNYLSLSGQAITAGTVPVSLGGTGITSLAETLSVAATRILVTNGSVMGWRNAAHVCFLKGTKITLPNHEQKPIEDLKLGEQILTYHVEGLSNLRKKDKVKIMNWSQGSMNGSFKNSKVRNIWVNPADQYLILNEKLQLTNKHIIHVKRDNEFKFLPAEDARIGDELFTDREHYEEIHTIEQKNEKVEVYNIEVNRNRTYFAENYLVHHFCETCAGFAERI